MKTILLSVFFLSTIIIAGCKQQEPKKEVQAPAVQTEVKTAGVDSTIIRSKDVDVAKLDLNKDGKVFQCPMHAQVISDIAGPCPLCNMDLDEVSIAEAKEALK